MIPCEDTLSPEPPFKSLTNSIKNSKGVPYHGGYYTLFNTNSNNQLPIDK
jgi:hypothetical protein